MKPYYQDASVTIYCGDCREILSDLPSGRLAVVTDPPFGVRQDGWDALDERGFAAFSMSWMSAARSKSDLMVAFHSVRYAVTMTTLAAMLFRKVRQLIWDKPLGSEYAGAADDGMWYAFEPMVYCCDTNGEASAAVVARLIREGRERCALSRGAVDKAVRGVRTGLCYRWEEASCLPTDEQAVVLSNLLGLGEEFDKALRSGSRLQAPRYRDVFSHRSVTGGLHPCEKPAGLMREVVDALVSTDAVVLDPFMGSGTTLRAAKDLGRRAIGIEIEERYCEIAAKRCAQETLFAPEAEPANDPEQQELTA